jgi:hypothetical protein
MTVKYALTAALVLGFAATAFAASGGTVTLIGNLQAKGPWPQRFTLRLLLGAMSA